MPRRRGTREAGERDPALVSDVLSQLADRRGWKERLALGRLNEHWSEVVGAQIAGRSRPIKLEAGRLTIRVEPGAWAAELALLGASLATAAADFLGHDLVHEVAIVTGSQRRV